MVNPFNRYTFLHSLLSGLIILFTSCVSTYVSPHTKKGQSKITDITVNTPYYIQHLTANARVPFSIKWVGPGSKLIIKVEYIIRPTSPRIRFPIYQDNLTGNKYTVYRDVFDIKGLRIFEGDISVWEKGDYKITCSIVNTHWVEHRSSHFKIY